MKEKDIFTPLDEEERDLMESLESGEWVDAEEIEEYQLQAIKYAEATMKKNKRMNIRISERDLRNLKIRAMEEGLPYQTLVSIILHKYISGKLLEKV